MKLCHVDPIVTSTQQQAATAARMCFRSSAQNPHGEAWGKVLGY